MNKLNELAKDFHANAQAHGWWENPKTFGEIIALCHSELSEALEEFRNNKPFLYKSTPHGDCQENCARCKHSELYRNNVCKPEGVAIELADCIIRILDYCAYAEIDIDEAIRIKHDFNKTRPYKHGNKKI